MEGCVQFFKELKEGLDRLNTENAERAKEIEEHSEEITLLKEVNEKQNKEIQDLKDANSKQLDLISDLRTENDGLKNKQGEESVILRKDISSLHKTVEEFRDREAEVVQTESPAGSFATKVNGLERDYAKLKRSVRELGDEVKVGMKSMETNFIQAKEYCSRTDRLQKMFNNLHLSLQSRKEMEEEVKRLKADINEMRKIVQPKPALTNPGATSLPVFVPLPAPTGQHPSKKAQPLSVVKDNIKILKDNLKIEEDFIKTTKFGVVFEDAIAMEYGECFCVDGYDKVIQACEFMDPKSGIFTVPAKGRYDFGGVGTWQSGRPLIYVCSDRDDYRQHSWYGGNGGRWDRTLDCEAGDKVWLEVQGDKSERHNKVTGITFTGTMVLSEQSQKLQAQLQR